MTANLKRLANAEKLGNIRGVNAALGNIKGAYTQTVMRADRFADGFKIVDDLLDLRHVNANGYDLVLQRGGIIRIFEAKSGTKLTLKELSNYVRKAGDERLLNMTYFRKWIEPALGKQATDALLKAGTIEIEFFINNPRSADIAQ